MQLLLAVQNVLRSLSCRWTCAELIDNAGVQVDAPMVMRSVPDNVRFIILQGPSHASLSEGNVGTETLSCVCSLARKTCQCRIIVHLTLRYYWIASGILAFRGLHST